MNNHALEKDSNGVDALRDALIDAALLAYEDAGLRGLCAEGRWEAAVDAMRSLDVVELVARATPRGSTNPIIDGAASSAGTVAAVDRTRAP